MQVKIPSEDESPKHDKICTSSIYISQPSVSTAHESDLSNNVDSNSSSTEQKPVLTIQVNQDNSAMMNQSTSNLVNIVSCFRAYPTIAHSSGIENVVHSINAPFSVNVNRNYFNYGGSNKSNDESVNNENNQNIVNVEASSKNYANAHSKLAIKRDDLNEIRVDQSLISENGSGTVDYQNMTLDSVSNRDQTGLIGATEIEKIVIAATAESSSANSQQTTESVINQITVAGGVESTDNRVSNDSNNCTKSESQTQTFREQRRRERRERRQARQRAQHGHHHAPAPVHQRLTTGIRMVNGAEPSRTSYEALPDIINNHLPPPYTTLPLQMPAPPIHSPLAISSVPVVVDDCRFSFPIPIIRRSPSEHSGRKGCCGQIFQSPKSLGLIAVLALGGVACSLGGAAWGASGLAGPPSSHVTISLLMIGIGVVLVTISGVAWRISNSDSSHCLGMEGTEFEHCGRQQCSNSMSHGLLYPEFQHRPPPPSYQSSMQEYRLRLLLLDRDRQSHGRRIAAAVAAAQQSASPPPTYRSNSGSQLRSHRSTVLGNASNSGTAGNIFTELTGIISNIPATTTLPTHQACSNRLNAVPSNEGNYHNSNNSPTHLSAVNTSIQEPPAITTTQISQAKSRLSINHSGNDDDFNRRRTSEFNLHPTKDMAATNQLSFITNVSGGNGVNNSDESHRRCSHENGLVTIVTINSLGVENGNSIV